MLPLPIFQHHRPTTLVEATALLARLGDGAKLIAGGTDLLPNMKQGLFDFSHLVSLSKVKELSGITLSGDAEAGETLSVGAGMHLVDVSDSVMVTRLAQALAEACGAVGGPHHRAMGTLGGNICLDTRCRYYNQTYFWRKSLGFCLKKDGTVCHVVKGGQRCVAAASNDSAAALLALGATIHVVSVRGERSIAAVDFYTADGIKNTVMEPDEIVVRASLPVVPGRTSAYEKLRRRAAIDFPLLSVAARIDRDPHNASWVKACDVVVSALGARPRRLRAAAEIAPQTPLVELPSILAKASRKECKPLPNVDEDTAWRHDMVPVLVKKAVLRAAGL